MTKNIVNINQHDELEVQLRSDAKKLNDEVSSLLKEKLLSKIAKQKAQEKAFSEQHHFSLKNHSLVKNKLAIAASLVFSVFVIQFLVTQKPPEKTTIAINQSSHNIHNIDEMLSGFSAELKNKDLLASQNLNNEYKAILADMEKVKLRIIKL